MKIFNKRNLIALILIVIIVSVLVLIIVLNKIKGSTQQQEVTAQTSEQFGNESENKETNKNMPFVNPQTGTLLDGPGFEKGEVDGVSQDSLSTVPSNYYFLDDGANGEMSIQHNLCSKSCCSAQWPTPFKQKYDPYVCGSKGQFVPSQIFCNNSFQDAGCLCLNKNQAQFLYNRGGNGRELF
jgi:hypothetical protein